MSKKAALFVVIAAIVAFATTAGGGAAKPNAQFTIGFIPPVLANPAIKALNDGIAAKAKALGMSFETIGGQYSPQAQIVAMDAAIQKKVSMILIWPLDPKGIQPSFLKAKAAGIPILAATFQAETQKSTLEGAPTLINYKTHIAFKSSPFWGGFPTIPFCKSI